MKKSKIFIAAGLLAVCLAVCMTGYNLWDDHRAGSESEKIIEKLAVRRESADDPTGSEKIYPDAEMPEKTVDGRAYIGVLEIPELSLDLPVQSGWDYKKLKISPCRYVGTAYKSGFVIAAHNYNRHFGRIKNLSAGDTVSFVDVDENVFNYTVAEVIVMAPTDIEEMISDRYDLTLFTCTVGGRTRVAVRCIRTK